VAGIADSSRKGGYGETPLAWDTAAMRRALAETDPGDPLPEPVFIKGP
jgi:hypothetical protein